MPFSPWQNEYFLISITQNEKHKGQSICLFAILQYVMFWHYYVRSKSLLPSSIYILYGMHSVREKMHLKEYLLSCGLILIKSTSQYLIVESSNGTGEHTSTKCSKILSSFWNYVSKKLYDQGRKKVTRRYSKYNQTSFKEIMKTSRIPTSISILSGGFPSTDISRKTMGFFFVAIFP